MLYIIITIPYIIPLGSAENRGNGNGYVSQKRIGENDKKDVRAKKLRATLI